MKFLRLAIVGAGLVLMSACGSGTSTQSAGGHTVNVTLDEYKVQVDSTSIGASKVTFQIANKGKVKHEFVILRTDIYSSPSALPTAGDKVQEDATGIEHVDEIDGLAAGEEKDLTVDLKPGTYLLICNYPGHVHDGMLAVLKVT